jgi:hypothetical protein
MLGQVTYLNRISFLIIQHCERCVKLLGLLHQEPAVARYLKHSSEKRHHAHIDKTKFVASILINYLLLTL